MRGLRRTWWVWSRSEGPLEALLDRSRTSRGRQGSAGTGGGGDGGGDGVYSSSASSKSGSCTDEDSGRTREGVAGGSEVEEVRWRVRLLAVWR